jgi:carboxymethylenebutenolidase
VTAHAVTLPSGTACVAARPDHGDRRDYGLVIGPDMVGLRQCFSDMAAMLADTLDWVVVAPEPFPGRESWGIWDKYALMADVDATAQLEDILAAADATGCERVGLLGFCLGGFHAYRAAPTDRFESLVAMYGPIVLPEVWRTGRGQEEPLEALARPRRSPVLAIIAGLDTGTPAPDVDALRRMDGVEVVVYPEADHAFVHDPSRETHRSADAADAMARAISFLESASPR